MTGKNCNIGSAIRTIPSISSRHKKSFWTICLFLILLAAAISLVRSGNAQTAQVLPDWTNIQRDFFNLSQATTEPVLTPSMITDRNAVSYVADPFLFNENGQWYMFFEVNQDGVFPNLKAEIGLATSSNGLTWTYQQIVLSEPFPLAYPYVFKWNNSYYMVPDTFSRSEVRLYRATNFPYDWTFVSTLVAGRDYVDSSVFHYDDTWWMFTSAGGNTYLFYSNDLVNQSSWTEHPMNPIVSSDAGKARGGGRVIVFNGNEIVRLGQNSSVTYGYSVRAFQVDTLTKTSYAEHEVSESPLVAASGSGWNADGMHHVDAWWVGDRWLAAVDGVDYSPTEVWSIGIYQSPVVVAEYPSAFLLQIALLLIIAFIVIAILLFLLFLLKRGRRS